MDLIHHHQGQYFAQNLIGIDSNDYLTDPYETESESLSKTQWYGRFFLYSAAYSLRPFVQLFAALFRFAYLF
jgi:hypothetical protein